MVELPKFIQGISVLHFALYENAPPHMLQIFTATRVSFKDGKLIGEQNCDRYFPNQFRFGKEFSLNSNMENSSLKEIDTLIEIREREFFNSGFPQ